MNIRLVVKEWNETCIVGYEAHDASRKHLSVAYDNTWQLASQLYPQATLNLLDVETDAEGVLHPLYIILSPDYLVDITTICQCVKSCGITPIHYLMNKFMPKEDTLAIQLGNAANQFLDDAVNRNTSFFDSMQKNFKDYPLKYCTLEGVDEKYFAECRKQHSNIQQVVAKYIQEADVQLEPSFVCEALGIQGRMDLLTDDYAKIVELKSGKRDEFHDTFKTEHAWQMALYKEMLHYSLGLPKEAVKTLLLYSKYPYLYNITQGKGMIKQALIVRNGIVHIDRLLRTDCKRFILSLTEQDFNPVGASGKLYQNYIRPRIISFLDTLHNASPLELDYFCTMVSFVAREQYLAKVGDERPESDRAFARAWLCDAETKRIDGNIITDLVLSPDLNEEGMLTHIVATVTQGEIPETNFREGDSVVLYERNTEADNITNRQSVRCHIESFTPDRILLRLPYPQRGTSFLYANSRYAIEPSYSDGLFNTYYRGLYALLACPEERRTMILSPQVAKDFELLVGPPGSGKTSIALRNMVARYMPPEGDERQALLLMAYTNRAVDEICQMLEHIEPTPSYLRIGNELSCPEQFRHRLMRNAVADCPNRDEIQKRLAPIRILCGTVASLSGIPELFKLKRIPIAILDEASQVLEPQLLPLLCATTGDGKPAISRFILIGDHKQLPAVVVQPASESAVEVDSLRRIGLQDCRDSLFERLLRCSPTSSVAMLSRQGRMHESINAWVSQTYYGSRLDPVPLPHQVSPLPWHHFDTSDTLQATVATRRMAQFDTQQEYSGTNPKINTSEANIVAQIVQTLYRLSTANHVSWNPETGIGIIVPFRAQISAVRTALSRTGVPDCEKITIDTVERYQGSQRDTIIYSTIVSHAAQLPVLSSSSESVGQFTDRRLNVAVTRSREQFFLVGNLALLRRLSDYNSLIGYIDTL